MGGSTDFWGAIGRMLGLRGSADGTSSNPLPHIADVETPYEAEQSRLIEWLERQPPSIVDAAARLLNWDYAENVILWILNQPTTDAATAVHLFLLSEPSYYVPFKSNDGSLIVYELDSDIIKTFTTNWSKDFYSRGNVSFNPRKEFGFILEELKQGEAEFRTRGMVPWPPLEGLEGPFRGERTKDLLNYFKKDKDEQSRIRAMYEDLGVELASN